MKGGERPLGYTIVEVMIVLAVSGLMFVVAANFINGKQARNSFQQGVNEMASRIQGVISDVTDGHYSDIPMTCSVSGGVVDPEPAASGGDQGTNPGCVFMGKMLHFKQDTNAYEVFSLAGARENNDGTPVTTLSEAKPTVIEFLTSPHTVPQALNIRSMKVTTSSGSADNNKWTIGFAQGLGSAETSDSGAVVYASGAQAMQLIYASAIANQPMPLTSYGPVNASITAAKGAVLCVTDNTRYARISIGEVTTGNNSPLDVRTKIVPNEAECTA